MKITVLDGFGLNTGDLSWDAIREFGELTIYTRTPKDKVIERALGSEIVLTNRTVLDAEVLRQLPGLKFIGVLATGYNAVDVKEAARLGIVVSNIPSYSTMSVAQMTFALLLAITNRVEYFTEENRAGRWTKDPDYGYTEIPLIEIAGKKMGIVGYGHIGSAVTRIALAMGLKPVVYTSKEASALPEGVEKASDLDSIFRECDIVSLHCPINDDTYQMVDSRRLAMMKRTAIIINTGRGPLIDEDALALALNNETIYAAAADVMVQEPPRADNPLLSARNFFVTPHVAWGTFEARKRLMGILTENIRCFLAGNPINVVS